MGDSFFGSESTGMGMYSWGTEGLRFIGVVKKAAKNVLMPHFSAIWFEERVIHYKMTSVFSDRSGGP